MLPRVPEASKLWFVGCIFGIHGAVCTVDGGFREPRGKLKMAKVLVVEDSPVMRGLIGSLVDEIEDIEVVEVENGLEALRVLPKESFDLIITDINMPNINGLELLSFIRNNPQHVNTPVLVVTTEGAERDREKGIALGATAYLCKPFENSVLIETVRDLLKQAQ